MSKNKHEVSSARFRLNATLQDLVEKKDDGLSDDDDSQPDVNRVLSSPASSPSKRAFTSKAPSRKRRRKDDSDSLDAEQYHHTYVMKLFDRSVDLAQFEENTPLYPICRAWMFNQPHSKSTAQSSSPEIIPTSDDEAGNVYRLPDPVFIKTELGGEYNDLRIPSPLPQTDPSLDINAEPEDAPPPEQLLLNHIARWKHTRQRWKDASLRNECRFAPSMNLLRDMIEQQMRMQQNEEDPR